jgi:hypothetical protein
MAVWLLRIFQSPEIKRIQEIVEKMGPNPREPDLSNYVPDIHFAIVDSNYLSYMWRTRARHNQAHTGYVDVCSTLQITLSLLLLRIWLA